MRPHRRQPTRLPRPWDSPDKNTGVGCHFLLQCMKVKSQSEVTQSCLTLSDPMDCSLPGSFVHEIFQARVLEWGAIAFSEPSQYCKAIILQLKKKSSCRRKIKKRLTQEAYIVLILQLLNLQDWLLISSWKKTSEPLKYAA